jgi:superfamily II DNA or RNA helicase
VDVPRLAVGVYATATATPLFFAQAIGRFVRARRRGETASIFLPNVALLLGHAGSMEIERDHALSRKSADDDDLWSEEDGLLAAANAGESASGELEGSFEALHSAAEFDHVLFDAEQFGLGGLPGSQDEEEFLGLPGLLEPDQVAHVLRERQKKQVGRGGGKERAAAVSAHRALAEHRKELNKLVSAYAQKKGQPHAVVHAELRRTCGGPELATASSEQVGERIALIRRWFVGRT